MKRKPKPKNKPERKISDLTILVRGLRHLEETQRRLIPLLYTTPGSETVTVPPRATILYLHDFHIGYADFSTVEKALTTVRPNLIVISELFDFPAFSSYPDLKINGTDTELELEIGLELLKLLSRRATVHIIPSNHEDRILKRLALLSSDARNFLNGLLERYMAYVTNTPRIIRHRAFYLCLKGRNKDVWVTHGDRFLLNPGAASRDVVLYLGSNATITNFSYDRTYLVITAHEHRPTDTVAQGAQIRVISAPCCCLTPFYAINRPPSRYSRFPSATGWIETVHDDRGNPIPHRTRMVIDKFVR